MSDPYPIDPNTDSSIDLATVIEVLADDPKVVGDRSDYHPTRGRVVKETPSGNRWLGDGDQWISLESDVGLSSPSVSTDELSHSYGVVADYYVDADDEVIQEYYPTTAAGIQSAVDALPLQQNEYITNDRTGGEVRIYSVSGEEPYDGPIELNRKGTYRGVGRWVELANTQTSDPTLLVDATEGTPDDVYIRDLWVEGNNGGPAIRSEHRETHLQNLNIEAAPNGEPSVILNGDRSTAHDIEQKASGMQMNADQGYFNNWFINKELGQPIVTAFDVQGSYNNFVNCHGWPAESSNATIPRRGVNMVGNQNTFYGTVGTSPENSTDVISVGLRITGSSNYFSGRIFNTDKSCVIRSNFNTVRCNIRLNNGPTSIEFSASAAGNVVFASGEITASDISWSGGGKNIVNGWSVNSGNPATTGAWNGDAERAAKYNATVIDTSASSPLPRYSAQPDGSGGYEWVEVSVTAA